MLSAVSPLWHLSCFSLCKRMEKSTPQALRRRVPEVIDMMKSEVRTCFLFHRQIAVLFLASVFAVPVLAQQGQPAADSQPAAAVQPQSPALHSQTVASDKEGFWGRINPFARKKWVKKRIDPIKDRLSELDEVQAKNSRDIKDVDTRAQAGISQAQSTASQAGQAAADAGRQANSAQALAQQASGQVGQLNSTVSGLDQFRTVGEIDILFPASRPVLSTEARQQIDNLVAGLAGRQGYILDLEGHASASGPAGLQISNRLDDAVQRYLVLDHQIPVYRVHAVALGNAPMAAGGDNGQPVRGSSVHLRLMENSLAAQGAAPPQGSAPLNGAERP